MALPTGMYFIDGIDIWTTFSIGVESGSDGFLKIPERKESTTHDWMDENGIDVDLSRTFFKSREVQMKCFTITKNEQEFWDKYDKFLTLWAKPGTRRLSITELSRDFYVYYKDNNLYERFTRIKNSTLIACKFTLTVEEPHPNFNSKPTFIINEAGRFIIT